MISASTPALQIVVLAAGFSTRMGRPKALAKIRGRTLLARTLAVLAAHSRERRVIVIVPPRTPRYRAGIPVDAARFIANRQRRHGLSRSVCCALSHARYAAAVLIVPVDLARLGENDVKRLILRWCGARRRVVASRIGAAASVPLILPQRLFAPASAIDGDRGLRDFVRRLSPAEVTLVDLRAALADVDTPQDLQAARRRAPRRSG